ncbi:sensor histidine kinase [Flavihumibacter petaseus]|uniref:histidine kinase n=1 Tax=Flavihumibacter petaseus NBRC 106054 TaxID=1220578 RepID=A0A0E9N6D8_9BACT|nr:HAMP domain-containing sensor histidine kinase [Flavihumibacter petaseus]GAO45507.1 putative two-component histidine kinase [Flavihumibacter petaseus NBRC 106054]
MKLVHKFTLWYLSIAMVCTIAGTMITYVSVKDRISKAATKRLEKLNQSAVARLDRGEAVPQYLEGAELQVEKITGSDHDTRSRVSQEDINGPFHSHREIRLTVATDHEVNGVWYRIRSFDYVTHTDQILSGIEASIIWKWSIILGLIFLTASLASRIILGPFHKALRAIGRFNIKKQQPIRLPDTNTLEFRQLNHFVKGMSDKAIEDYSSLKEFTENASHELQTPVAIMRGKLELLAETVTNDEQAILISDLQQSLEKMSKINQSLTLLARLENHEYAAEEPIRFCRLINASLATYQELVDMKGLRLEKTVEKQVWVNLHPLLADMLLNNLISNAIRHNTGEGRIVVSLSKQSLRVSNTGDAPANGTDELFSRFKKGNQCSKGVGIGLAIVKQICELNQFVISYIYQDGWHHLQVDFDAVTPPSGHLPGDDLTVRENQAASAPVNLKPAL